jgi:hypothetical protein
VGTFQENETRFADLLLENLRKKSKGTQSEFDVVKETGGNQSKKTTWKKLQPDERKKS